MPRRIVDHSANTQRARHSKVPARRPESVLWGELKEKQVYGYAFARACRIDRCSVDFYCEALRLAIAVDPVIRMDKRALRREKRRCGRLAGHDITVLHFTDEEVMHNLDGVVGHIRRWVRTRPERWGIGKRPADTLWGGSGAGVR